MRNYPFPHTAVLVLAMACASQAAEKPRPAQANQNHPKKVWTNDDMDQLRSRGLISIVGQEPAETPAPEQAAPPAGEASFPVYESRLDDPEWYAMTAAELQDELDKRMAELQQEQDAISLAKDRVTQPGINLDEPSIGVTPAAALEILQARVQEIQSQLDELADLARQHDIPPGDLRS
ncbi:MAG TPA: hypothetical protein VNY09_05435 [Candidatus Sulfotelmatobacter sp.]|jgi:hypothetical protein|nr:hypothetical protein [Candidatus Sulfotelmatobacter sp.]